MRVLVTGVAGFIGSNVARALLARGDEVRGLDNFINGFPENVPEGVEFVEADLRDLDAVVRATNGVEAVCHQAALRSVPKSVDDPVTADRCNTLGTLNLLVAAQAAGVRRVVYASSSSVYGDPPDPLRIESQPTDPQSPYAVSKLAGEQYCRVWTVVHGLSTVSLRYFNVFGPGQRPDSKYSAVFPAFVSALVDGRAPEIHWDGEQSRDFTFIDDVVQANLLALDADSRADGMAMNIGGGDPKTINETLRAVSDALGIWVEPTYLPRRAGDVRATHADASRAASLLGWHPRVSWPNAVRGVVEWFQHSSVRFQ